MMSSSAMGLSQSPLTPAKARLSDQQKKDNHISSEKKRREAIRAGFDKLSTLVPGMDGQARSEAIVLGATVTFMQDQLARKQTVRQLALARGWSNDRIDRVYTDFENNLRALEGLSTGIVTAAPGQLNGQGQFQHTYTTMPPQSQMMSQPQSAQPVVYQQQQATPARRSKSKSPQEQARSPIRKSPSRSPKRTNSE